MKKEDASRAACLDSEYAFQLAFSDRAQDHNEMKSKFCNNCPIVWICQEEAFSFDSYGVWGGTTRTYRDEYRDILTTRSQRAARSRNNLGVRARQRA